MNAHRIRLDPTTLAVAPGREATCTVHVTNLGDVVDAFDVQVLGPAAAWTVIEPAAVSLFPGKEGAVRLSFRPPQGAGVPAGPMPFGVRVMSRDAGMATSVVEEGSLEIGTYRAMAADLAPRTSHGIFSGRHRVRLTNGGNAPATVRLSGSDAEQALDIDFRPAAVQVPSGATAEATVKARCRNLAFAGEARQWSFTVVAEAEDTPPVELPGVMMQRPLLGRLTRRVVALGAIVLVGLAIYNVKGADIRSAATAALNANRAGSAATPGPSGGAVPPGGASPAAATSPSAGASATPNGRPSGVGGPVTGPAPVVVAAACAGNGTGTSSPAGLAPIPGLSATFDNGAVARTALVQLSANLGVDVDAEVRVAYSVDGQPAQENAFGPANLANHQQYFETRDVSAVIPLGPGSHTIVPNWRVSGVAGKAATADKRCLTVRSVLSSPSPTSQVVAGAACASSAISTTSTAGAAAIPGLAVSVNGGGATRQAIVEVSANLGIDVDAEVRLAYSVDGQPAQENAYGPANLANPQQYYEARDATAVIPLGPGAHTITAFWRVSGAAGKTAHMDRRCLTVEAFAPGAAGGPALAATCPGGAAAVSAPAAAAPMPAMAVTIDNGPNSRPVVVEVTANLGIDPDAELRLAYSVDGLPAQENAYGPANLANHQEYFETRSATAVIPLGPGAHSITAYWRVSGAAGKTAHLDKRCLTAESLG